MKALLTDFYVAPSGNDRNPGTKRRPFATPGAARDAVRTVNGGIKHIVKFTVLTTAVTVASARQGVLNLGPAYYDVTPAIATPHIPWAKPLAGGPIRALIIAPLRAQRETVELWQRLDLDYTAIGVLGRDALGDPVDPNGPVGATIPEVTARLRAAMSNAFDVAVVSDIHMEAMPPDVVSNLLQADCLGRKTRSGAVCQGGRVSAPRQDDSNSIGVSPSPPPLPLGERAGVRGLAEQTAGAAASAGALACRLTLRDRWNQVMSIRTQAVALAAGPCFVSIPIGAMKGGRHRAEVQFLDTQGRVVNWGVWTFTVSPPFAIKTVRLLSEEIQPQAPVIEGTVELAGDPVSGATLAFSVKDSHGRVVGQETCRARSGPFRVRLLRPLAVYHELVVRLRQGADILDEARARAAATVKGPGWDDYSFLLWQMPNEGAIGRHVSRELVNKYEADTFYCASWQTPQRIEDILWCVAEDGAWPVPYLIGLNNYWGSNHRRGPCLSETNFMCQITDNVREAGQRARKFRPTGYSLGDEDSLDSRCDDVCLCPLCAQSFRVWLRARYPSLEALNAEWNSAFTNWGDVTAAVRADALASNQVPRWVDHRLHMSSVFIRTFRRCYDAIRQTDPLARVGYDGGLDSPVYGGHDYWESSKFMEFWGPYPYSTDWQWAASSFFPRTSYVGIWCGGYPDIRYDFHARSWPWSVGGVYNSIWWFCACDGSMFAALSPDLRPYGDFQIFVGQVRRLKAGVGKLLLHAVGDRDAVRIYYAQDSIMVNAAYGLPIGGADDYRAMAEVIDEAGYSAIWMSPEQVIREQWKDCRALFLPGTQALSESVADSLRRFVRGGGLLVANVRPGVTDEHGKIRKAGGILDDVFGVLQNTSLVGQPAITNTVCLTNGPLGRVERVVIDPAARVDPAAKDVTYGTASNGLPYLVAHRYGQGAAVLINTDTRQAMGLGAALRPHLARAGVAPHLTPLTIDPARPPVKLMPYRDGRTMLYRIQAWSTNMVLHGPASAHWYLAETNWYLGCSSNPCVRLPADNYARVLVGLPYQVRSLTIAPADSWRPWAKSREKTFRLTVHAMDKAPVGYHVIRITVKGPDGKERPYHAANVGAVNGKGEYILPLAHNEPAGVWTVHARDVATGAAASAVFDVPYD